jgi:uncharacterized protein YoxC
MQYCKRYKGEYAVIIEVSVGVMAVAVVFLVIYLIITLRQLKKTLGQVNQTASILEKDTHELLNNTNGLISETRAVIVNVKEKADNMQTLFKAVDQIGKQMNEVSAFVSKAAAENKEKLGGILAIVGAAMNLVQEWRQNNEKRRMQDG